MLFKLLFTKDINELSFFKCVQGYRYWSGIGVERKCETALTYYRKVATTGMSQETSDSMKHYTLPVTYDRYATQNLLQHDKISIKYSLSMAKVLNYNKGSIMNEKKNECSDLFLKNNHVDNLH